jgi:hypothetical protein
VEAGLEEEEGYPMGLKICPGEMPMLYGSPTGPDKELRNCEATMAALPDPAEC